jgi:hypothetical protein
VPLADIDVNARVLSLTNPGVQNLAPEDAVSVARETNDALAEIVDSQTPSGSRP